MKRVLVLTIASAALFLNSCKKDDDSDLQPKGNYGVITSSSTVTLNNWTSDYDDGTEYNYSSSVSWPAITQNIVDKGIVMVYEYDGISSWYALPYSDGGSGWSDALNFAVSAGRVYFLNSGYDDTGSPGASSMNGTVVRIVAIDNAGKIANPDLDWTNYNEVCKRFGLTK